MAWLSYDFFAKISKITDFSGSARVSFDSAFDFVLLTTSFDNCSGGVVVTVAAAVVEVDVVVVVAPVLETDDTFPLPRDGQSPTFVKSLA